MADSLSAVSFRNEMETDRDGRQIHIEDPDRVPDRVVRASAIT